MWLKWSNKLQTTTSVYSLRERPYREVYLGPWWCNKLIEWLIDWLIFLVQHRIASISAMVWFRCWLFHLNTCWNCLLEIICFVLLFWLQFLVEISQVYTNGAWLYQRFFSPFYHQRWHCAKGMDCTSIMLYFFFIWVSRVIHLKWYILSSTQFYKETFAITCTK